MSYYNLVGISQFRNCDLLISDYSITKMCEEYHQQQKTARRDEGKLGKEEDVVFNEREIALKV